MKKLLLTSALFIALLSGVFANENDAVNFSGARAFKQTFPGAVNVKVKYMEQLTKVSFTMDDRLYEVFYSESGELVAKGKHITTDELPQKAAENLSSKYNDWHADEVIALTDETRNETRFFVSLSSAGKNMILEAHADGTFSIFRR